MTSPPSARHAILVAGMHRSGTSALARVLNLLGADLGNGLLPAREDNPRGYWEAVDVIALNDECLQHFGTAWFDPRPLPPGWEQDPWTHDWRRRLVDLLRRRHGDAALIAIKDPRVSRLLPAWREALAEFGCTAHVAISLRHPAEVVASLGKRQDARLSPSRTRLLWLEYLLRSEVDSRGSSRTIVTHDALLADWRRETRRLADAFGIAWPHDNGAAESGIDAFLDAGLHRQRVERLVDEREGRLATRCTALYGRIATTLPDIPLEILDKARERLADDLELADTPAAAADTTIPVSGSAKETLWAPSETVPLLARVYFPHADGRYDETRSHEVALPAAAGLRKVAFECPPDAMLSLLRFDPAEAPGIYRILALKINGHTIPAAKLRVTTVGGTRLADDADGAIRIHADQADPWIELSLEGVLAGQTALHTLEIHFERESFSDRLDHAMQSLAVKQQALADRTEQQHARLETTLSTLESGQQHALAMLHATVSSGAAHAARLERLRESSHAALLATYAAATNSRPPPRGGVRLSARPQGHLRLLAKRRDTDLRAWGCTGGPARFALEWTGGHPIAPGWYVLRMALQSAQGELPPPRLWIDDGHGMDDARVQTLALSPGSLRQRPLLHFDAPVHALALEPSPDDAHGEFLLGDTVSLRRIGRFEALLRLGLPAVHRLRAQGAGWREVLREVRATLRRGSGAALETLHTNAQATAPTKDGNDYAAWIAAHDTLDGAARAAIREHIAAMPSPPSISILLPVYNTPERWLRRCLDSVLTQLYPHWELCIADDASTEAHVRRVLDEYTARDARIKVVYRAENGHISAASNSALELAEGDWIALLDHDDELPEHALYHVARAILDHPDARLIYSDEDKITEEGTRFDPYFKPDWNPELFLGHNMFSHFGVYRHSLLQDIGGFREGYEGSQDYDLALRCIERVRRDQILHIPKVLYHWRAISGSTALAPDAKDYAHIAADKAIQEHLDRTGIAAGIMPIEGRAGNRRIRRKLPIPARKVSIIVPTRNGGDVLRRCIESIDAKTTYPEYDVLVVDNQSDQSATLELLDSLRQRKNHAVMVFDEPFNFSRLNNIAARQADGDVLVFLNDDTEIIDDDWLGELVSLALSPGIGAVGAMLYYPDDSIQHAGIVLGLGPDRIAGHAYHRMPRGWPGDKCRAQLVQEVSAVTAACMAIRRDRFDSVDGFDETLAVAFNDVDLCLRLTDQGYRNAWTPNAELYHHESHTRGSDTTPERRAEYLRECELMRKRWGDRLLSDPYYHPALSLDRGDFMTYGKPRHALAAPVRGKNHGSH